MDLIAGFPGESTSDFDETIRFLEETPWSRLHVFPYSEREGTPATRLPASVPKPERSRRALRLRELSLERMTRHYEERARRLEGGELAQVLLERAAEDGFMHGFSPDYLRVRLPADAGLRNQIVTVRLHELKPDRAGGEVTFEASISPSIVPSITQRCDRSP
jgi:threonylcarbamoyladenosine tRNA methylthiotransferase MtaB